MNLEKIKMSLEDKKGKTLRFRFNGARNQTEEFDGVVIKTYHFVFLVQTKDQNKLVKSFTYSDVLTESLEISEIVKK